MLRYHRIAKSATPCRRFLSIGTGRSPNESSGGWILIPTLAVSTAFGTAYMIEHKHINEEISEKLRFLEPIQKMLRDAGYGRHVNHEPVNVEKESEADDEHNKQVNDQINAELTELENAVAEDIESEPVQEQEEQSTDSDDTDAVSTPDDVDASPQNQHENEEQNQQDSATEEQSEETVPEQTENVDEENVAPCTDNSSSTAVAEEAKVVEEPVSKKDAEVATENSKPATDAERLLALRVSALEEVLGKAARDAADLRGETERTLIRDLEELDTAALRYRIAQLTTEFFDRVKWEGARQQQALKEAEALFAQRYGELLSQQRGELTVEMERRVLEKERELMNVYQQKQEEIQLSYEKRLQEALSTQAEKLSRGTKEEVEKREAELRAELTDEHTHELAMLKERHVKSLLEVQNEVTANNAQLAALRDVVDQEFGRTTVSSSSHALSAAVLMAESALRSSSSAKKELEALRVYAGGDELILAVVDSLPRAAFTTGVPNLPIIKARFSVAKEEARKAGLAPEGAPPMLGQMIGTALAYLSFEPTAPVQGEGIEAVLSRAASHVDVGDLQLALEEIDSIKGYPRTLLRDWEAMVRDRLVADQAAKALRAAASIKHAQFI